MVLLVVLLLLLLPLLFEYENQFAVTIINPVPVPVRDWYDSESELATLAERPARFGRKAR